MTRREGLALGDGFFLPLEAVTQTFAILARRGRGKTYTASVLVEEMLRHHQRVVVIDPVGVWWGLRSSADGTGPGFPVVVLGGEHADLPLEPGSGELVGDLVVDQELAVVLDLSNMRKTEQRKFLTPFLETVYRRNRDPLHLVVDEADAFAPQKASGDAQPLLDAVDDFVRRGRARGLGVTLITQRPAVLAKDVLTQTEVLIALQTTGPQDRRALDDWISQHDTGGHRDEFLADLASLPIGTAWVWSPSWLDEFRRVNVRRRTTYDSSATPKVGQRASRPTGYASVDLDALRKSMAGLVERTENDDPVRLRDRIAELERRLVSSGISDEERAHIADLTERLAQRETEVATLRSALASAADLAHTHANSVNELAGTQAPTGPTSTGAADDRGKAGPVSPRPADVRGPDREMRGRPRPTEPTNGDGTVLRAGARRMLRELATFHPSALTRAQLATLSGMSVTGGTFATYLGNLRSVGYIDTTGGDVRATASGVEAAGDVPAAPATVAEVAGKWRATLRAGARRMLDVVVEAMPDEVGRGELAAAVEMEPTGGTFATYLGNLRSAGLVTTDRGTVRAGPALTLAAAAEVSSPT